jgi:uncharacterized protein (TIGR03437 family)
MKTTRSCAVLAVLLAPCWADAGQYVISTFAGGAMPPSPVDALSAAIGTPADLTGDANGNIYFSSLNCVFKLDAIGVVTRIAGTGAGGYSGDGGPAAEAKLYNPQGLAVDNSGNVYVADTSNNRIRRITPEGIIATIAGTAVSGDSGNGGPAVTATLNAPMGIALDGTGNLYIAELASIRKVSRSGIITVFAGTGMVGFSGDGGPAVSAQIRAGKGLAADAAGNIYFSDLNDQRIRKISIDGIITTVAGNVTLEPGAPPSVGGDGGPATEAGLNLPSDVFVATDGRMYISQIIGIRVVAADGTISALPISGKEPIIGIGCVWVSPGGSIFIADGNSQKIHEITADGAITVAGGPGPVLHQQANEPPTQATFNGPQGVAVDSSGNVLIADTGNSTLWRVSPQGAITFIGTPSRPQGVAIDDAGNYYVLDGAHVTAAHFTGPLPPEPVAVSGDVVFAPAVAVDRSGNIFLADLPNDKILKIAPGGATSTYAGTGDSGFSGDGGQATAAQLRTPLSLAVDHAGNLYIGDFSAGRIRKVSPDGIITTVAGGGRETGNNVPATSVEVAPFGIAVDESGDIFIADGSSQVQEVTPDGMIHTIAGAGRGYWGDGGPATSAGLNVPFGVAVDPAGNVYVAEQGNNIVRLLRPTNAPVVVGSVLDAASESAAAITPGKIVVIYGSGLGPDELKVNAPENNVFGPEVAGTSVKINGLPAPMIYSSAGQAAAIVPYGVSGAATAQVVVSSSAGVSEGYTVKVAPSAPSLFSLNGTGAGQVAAVNQDGSVNDAAHPAKIGEYISLYGTGEGQTFPAGVDGALAMSAYARPVLPVSVTVGGVAVTPAYAGAAPTEVAGLMQIVIQLPAGIQAGGYVPVDVKVGSESTVRGAAWIAVKN